MPFKLRFTKNQPVWVLFRVFPVREWVRGQYADSNTDGRHLIYIGNKELPHEDPSPLWCQPSEVLTEEEYAKMTLAL